MDLSSRNLLNANIHGRGDHVRGLLNRLVEDNFLKASRDLFPFTLRRLIQVLRVRIKTLVKEADDE